MNSITKWNKNSDEKTLVSTGEFLQFVGTGQKTREKALASLLEGGMYQNTEIAFYVDALRGGGNQLVSGPSGIEVNIPFHCSHTWEHTGEQEMWAGKVDRIVNFGSHVQFHISGRSGFWVIVGKTQGGNFLTITDDEAGFDLADPRDLFYNKEKVLRSCGDGGHCNTIDAVTAVHAFKALAEAGLYPE